MKIAVYLVGQWRGTSYDCSKYLKKIFEDYDTDYYIHTWESFNGKSLCTNKEGNDILDLDDYTHTSEDIEKIRNSYPNVVSMKVDSRELMNKILSTDTRLCSFPHFYCAYEANKVRRVYENMNGFRYDVIVKIRPDIIFGPIAIGVFKKNIEYVKSNPLAVYSYYSHLAAMPKDINLDWAYYTISSPFGMDCMMEWVDDIINNDGAYKVFSSNYFLKHGLISSPPRSDREGIIATPIIMRELFKYNNLVDLFYENEAHHHPFPYIHFLYDYLYRNNSDREKYDGWFDWISFDGVEYMEELPRSKENSKKFVYNEVGLKKLANLIIENYESDETRYRKVSDKLWP